MRFILDNKGFTLAEVLIAIAIFAIAVIGLAAMSGNAMRGLDSAKKLFVAINLAQAKLEALKLVPYANLEVSQTDGSITRTCTPAPSLVCETTFTCTPSNSPTGCTPGVNCVHENPTTINAVNYTWSWTVVIPEIDGIAGCSSSGDGLKRITMTVAWTDTFGSRTAILTTLRAK